MSLSQGSPVLTRNTDNQPGSSACLLLPFLDPHSGHLVTASNFYADTKEQVLSFLSVLREMKTFMLSLVCWMPSFLVPYEGASKGRKKFLICLRLFWTQKEMDFVRHGRISSISVNHTCGPYIKVYHNLYFIWLHSHVPVFTNCPVWFNKLSSEQNIIQSSCGISSASHDWRTLLLSIPKSEINKLLENIISSFIPPGKHL